ncbi:MAG: IS5 family transposase [Polyangiaceae bacterium]
MRGSDSKQASMLCLMSPESMVPSDHPIREIKRLCDVALAELSPTFDAMYSASGRPSIAPERLLKATLLMALYTIRSERQLCEQLAYNLLFRWFLDMNMTEIPFEHSTFSHNRQRLLDHEVAAKFFAVVVAQAKQGNLTSSDHFTVDGTMIEACASLKSFKKKDNNDDDSPDDPGNPTVNFHGETRRNDTHVSTTDPESKLYRKGAGKEAKLAFTAHALMENRNGLLVDFRIAEANGTAERDSALAMIADHKELGRVVTLGADKAYDTRAFVDDCRAIGVVPHVAQNEHSRRRSAIDARTTRHPGYSISQRIRKRVEEIFGWAKTVGSFRRTRVRGIARTQHEAYFVGAAYNLLRIANLCLRAAA